MSHGVRVKDKQKRQIREQANKREVFEVVMWEGPVCVVQKASTTPGE